MMIASFEHNFIFLKTRKTGGTSVEIVLSAWCSEHDIVTPMVAEDEVLRVEYGGLPRNFSGPADLEAAYVDAVSRRDLHEAERLHWALRRPLRRDGFYGHMPAASVRARLPDLWAEACTFTVERHPYEKVVSRAYWWRRRGRGHGPIEEIIEDVTSHPKLSDKYIYAEGNELLVDRILDFDRLWESIGALGSALGKCLPDPLPRAKVTARDDRRPAREILTKDQRRRLVDRCAFEFELLGFER